MPRLFGRITLVAVLAALFAGTARAQEQEITKKLVEEGAALYKGPGLCSACHGPDAKGVPNLGANLADDEWVHSDGSYEGIIKTILEGVSPDKSSTGSVMPPKGGSALSEEQIKAVAAYVWSLSKKEQ